MAGMRQVFLDTETTGLAADQGDRIIEIGCIEFVSRRPTGRNLHHYLNPERPCHPDAVRVHGLTDAFLSDKPRFAEIVDALLTYLAGAEVVIHNAAFDVGFLDAELARLGRPPFVEHVGGIVDSLALARETFPGKSNSLDALCRRLEVDHSGRALHGALLDAGLLAEVYIRLTRGQDSLVIDGDTSAGGPLLDADAVDLSAFDLPVPRAADDEAAAHAALLNEIDKECGGQALWREAVA
jgi:DNA polymerase-3 subunit epsilon